MSFVIAIPSLSRSEVLCKKTLPFLEKNEIQHSSIFVFVVKEEFEEYRQRVPSGISVVVGERGLVKQREFIHNYFQEGTHIICIDDDIQCVIDENRKPITTLKDVIAEAQSLCDILGLRLWGLYPTDNPFFFSDNCWSTHLQYIVGALYGYIKKGNYPTIPEDSGEDFYRTCFYYKEDGKVLRFNRLGIRTRYYSKGGMNTTRTSDSIDKGLRSVKDAFPEYVRLFTRKKSGKLDIRLKEKNGKSSE
jgi:hypothetical protein